MADRDFVVISWVENVANWAPGGKFLWGVGTPYLARLYLNRKWGRVMAGGLEFYPDRLSLEKLLPLRRMLGQADEIDAVYVNARHLVSLDDPVIRRIKRVILPDPNHPSFDAFAEAVSMDVNHLRGTIRTAIQDLQQHGISVRLFPGWIYSSMQIADHEEPNGWVHVELVFPGLPTNKRPNFILRRPKNTKAVQALAMTFEKMWNKSCDPETQS